MNNNDKKIERHTYESGWTVRQTKIVYVLPFKQDSNDSYGNFYIDNKMQGYNLQLHVHWFFHPELIKFISGFQNIFSGLINKFVVNPVYVNLSCIFI